MCTLVMLRRPGAAWPFLLAANRDELFTRPSLAPGRHWPGRSHVRGGLDVLAGGTWLGVNDSGVVASLLNRHGTFRPDPNSRSRGDVVLRALDHPSASRAAAAFAALDPCGWRPFNLIVADADHAFWLCYRGGDAMEATAIPAGLHMIEGSELDDPASPRLRHYLPRFATAPVPDPAAGDWQGWQALLASRESPTGRPEDAMCLSDVPIAGAGTAGTVSSTLLALPQRAADGAIFLHADGPPDLAPFLPVPRAAATGGRARGATRRGMALTASEMGAC